jgi:hypothetical protein
MFDVSQHAEEEELEGLRHSRHRLDSTADSPIEPMIRESLGGVVIRLIPELA